MSTNLEGEGEDNLNKTKDPIIDSNNNIDKKNSSKKHMLKKIHNYKYFRYIFIALLLVCIMGTLFIIFKTKNNKQVDLAILPCTNREYSQVIKKASEAQDPSDIKNFLKLEPISNEILAFNNYQKDAYCLHILTSKYIFYGDYENSKKYLDMLKVQLAKENKTDIEPVPNFRSVKALQESVDFQAKQKQNTTNNNPYKVERKKADGTILPEDRIQ